MWIAQFSLRILDVAEMGRSATVAGKIYVMLLAMLVVPQFPSGLTTAAGTNPAPNSRPFLARKQDTNILLMECQVPLMYTYNWRQNVNLHIKYKAHSTHAEVETIASLRTKSTVPDIIGRFKEVDMLQIENRVFATGTQNTCVYCRQLTLRMPVDETRLGDYFCVIKVNRYLVNYTVEVDDRFVKNSKSVTNTSFAVKSVKAHEISIRWNDAHVHVSRLGKVIVERTMVDAKSCAIQGAAPAIIFETVKDQSEPYENRGTLLYNKTGPDSRGENVLRLFVEADSFCFPNCLYTCEISRMTCKGETTDEEACAPKAEPVRTCPDTTTNNNNTVVALAVVCGVIPCLMLVVFFICWTKRGTDPVVTANSHVRGPLSDIATQEDTAADGYSYGRGYADTSDRGAFTNPGFALTTQGRDAGSGGAVSGEGVAVSSPGGVRKGQPGAGANQGLGDTSADREGVATSKKDDGVDSRGASSRKGVSTNACTNHEYVYTKNGYVCGKDGCGSIRQGNTCTDAVADADEDYAYTKAKCVESDDEDEDWKKNMRDGVEHQDIGTTQLPPLIDF